MLIHSSGAGSKFHKAEWYGVLQGGRKFDLFAEQHVAVHASQRRLVSRIYSMESLKDLEPYVHATVSRFIQKMRELQPSSVDMGKWLQLFAFGKCAIYLTPFQRADKDRCHRRSNIFSTLRLYGCTTG